ncbi:MAG: tyrosine-type recombinase/integrase [Candidatus Acidiferrales bacterium]
MASLKRVRVIKKIQQEGAWRYVSMKRNGNRYLWDDRPGIYFLEWWEGARRRREAAGHTPSEVIAAKRRKQDELRISAGILTTPRVPGQPARAERQPDSKEIVATRTSLVEARDLFLKHIQAHSPDKPATPQRYGQVLRHFLRLFGHQQFVESITRAEIDEYKIRRRQEKSEQHGRPITAQTVNFEVCTLRTFFYYFINERGISMKNPCKRFKHLRDAKKKAGRRPPTYSQPELDALFAACDEFERAVFATLLLTGLREQELCFLTWRDLDFKSACLRVSGEGKVGFSPKDYEERVIEMPPDLIAILSSLPRRAEWVFPTKGGKRLTHLLRQLKRIAAAAGVADATLHKFRHTYATRLLEEGADIVTVQKLMGHSDLETTRKYLSPQDELRRKAVNRLSLLPKSQPKAGSRIGPQKAEKLEVNPLATKKPA